MCRSRIANMYHASCLHSFTFGKFSSKLICISMNTSKASQRLQSNIKKSSYDSLPLIRWIIMAFEIGIFERQHYLYARDWLLVCYGTFTIIRSQYFARTTTSYMYMILCSRKLEAWAEKSFQKKVDCLRDTIISS